MDTNFFHQYTQKHHLRPTQTGRDMTISVRRRDTKINQFI